MRLLKRVIEKDGSGFVQVVAETSEDMWHAYNLISVGDFVTCSTIRKIQNPNPNAPIASQVYMEVAWHASSHPCSFLSSFQRILLTLELRVESVQFDSESCEMRISGQNQTTSEHVKVTLLR